MASKGATVLLGYTTPSSLALTTDLATTLSSQHNIPAHPLQADLSLATGPATLIAAAQSLFRAPFRLDIIINNAGIALNAPIPGVTAADFTATYAVNVLAPLLLIQSALPFLPTDRTGRIVNISSVSSSTGFVGQSVYGGTKAALEAMTRTWARELAERATVNAVNPGPVEGPMYASNTPEFLEGIKGWNMHAPGMAVREGVDAPEVVAEAREAGGRLAKTSEIAGVVGMLCTPDAQWCTGSVVCANGGMVMMR